MILIDTGPFVALFDPRDALHAHCREVLRSLREPLSTTLPVLTEAFHLLSPGSRGCAALSRFVREGGSGVCFLDEPALVRALELMDVYSNHPMDLADGSLIAAAESLRTRKIFTVDRSDFESYRIRIGHRQQRVEIIG